MIDKANIDKTNAWPFVEAKKILKERKNNTPNTTVIMLAPMNDESNSLNIIWNIIGIIIETPRIICRIPNVKKTVL